MDYLLSLLTLIPLIATVGGATFLYHVHNPHPIHAGNLVPEELSAITFGVVIGVPLSHAAARIFDLAIVQYTTAWVIATLMGVVIGIYLRFRYDTK